MAIRSIFYTSLIATLLLTPLDTLAAVILSEVQIEGEKAADEFVELYNDSNDSVNLSGWSLRRKSAGDTTAKGSSLKTFGSSDTIPANGYFLWTNSGSILKDLADTTTSSSLSDNNSLALYDKNGDLIDSLTWGIGHTLPFSPTQFGNPDKKESFTRELSMLSWGKTKQTSPTNSHAQSMPVEEEPPSPIDPGQQTILINEVFPNPKEKDDAGEFIELYNPTDKAINISGWEIRDASVSGKYTFPNGSTLPSLEYLVISDKEFSLSLNNSDEAVSLYDQSGRLVHQVKYEKTKEGVSLNLVGSGLRGARKPTPGSANSENTNPTTHERVPKEGYRDFAIEFHARGKDSDGDSLKFTWDFGDDHKSYKENTTHKYEKTGRYVVTLTTDDGIDTTTESFEIKIAKYEAPKLRIVALVPNPKGKDSDFEWIEIENRGKKSVNLNGFSIATGTKKKSVSNHPISKDFNIPGKSVRRITRSHSLFTLGNERGIIELRAPDGEVIHDVKYKFDKSLDDDVVLKKEKGKALTLITLPSEPQKSEAETPEENPDANTPSAEETMLTPPPTEESTEASEVQAQPADGANDTPKESLSKTISPSAGFPISSISFLARLFGVERGENKNILARWEDVLNTILNEWLTDTAVATKRPEESE